MIRASAETCYECLRGENKQKLEVLSFEKAWDKIEKDMFMWKFREYERIFVKIYDPAKSAVVTTIRISG